jgi:hypothetical protein
MDKVDAISIINDCIDSLHRIKEELLEDENEDDE